MVDLTRKPYYDTSKAEVEKGYTDVLFTSGKAIQSRELNVIGAFAKERSKKIVNLLYGNGAIITGCSPRVNLGNSTITIEEGKVSINGEIYDVDSATLDISTTGEVTVYAELETKVANASSDSSLKDPAEGFDNYNEEGADRLIQEVKFVVDSGSTSSDSNARLVICKLVDGVILSDNTSTSETVVTEDKPAETSDIDALDVIAQRQYETLGNYLIEGFQVKAVDCEDNTKIGLSIEPGVAYINGNRKESGISRAVFIKKSILTTALYNEEHPVDNSTEEYSLNFSPAVSANVSAPIKATSQLTYSSTGQNTIPVPVGFTTYRLIKVYTEGTSGKEYVSGTDFTQTGNTITWLSTGDHPASSFKIDYTYKAPLSSNQFEIFGKGLSEAILTLNVNSLGVAEIPSQYLNPIISSIKNSDGTALKKGEIWYQQGNKIKFATVDNAVLPVEVVRTNSGGETLPVVDGDVENIKYFSENGETVYEKYSADSSPDYDYAYTPANRKITWNGNKDYFPPVGETYIVNISVPVTSASNSISEVKVHILYELPSDLYTSRTYSSYLKIPSGTIYGVSASDTITVDSQIARTRKDSICLNRDGDIVIVHGSVPTDEGIYETKISSSLLKIADVIIKPTTAKSVAIYQTDNYRVRMQDIRDMFSKVKDIDYNISLTQLEQYAESLGSDYTLRGIVTDAFVDLRNLDSVASWNFIEDSSQIAIPNIAKSRLYPGFKRFTADVGVNTANTTAGKKGSVYNISSGNSEVLWVEQPYGTKSRTLTEGVYESTIFPSLSIDPDSDYFVADSAAIVGDGVEYYLPTSFNSYAVNNKDSNFTASVNNAFSSGNATIDFWIKLNSELLTNILSFEGTNVSIYFANGELSLTDGIKIFNYEIGKGFAGYWNHLAFAFEKDDIAGVYINGVEISPTSIGRVRIPNGGSSILGFNSEFKISGTTSLKFGGNNSFTLANIAVFNSTILDNWIYMFTEIDADTANLVGYFHSPLASATVANGSVSNAVGNLVGYGEIKGDAVSVDDFSGINNYINQKYIVNTVDVTLGNIKPEDTSVTVQTGNSTRTSSSSWTSGNWRYTTTTRTTTKTYEQTDTWYTKDTQTQVEDYGNFVTNVEASLTLRRIKITVHGEGLLPYTDPIEIKFNGEKVNLFATADTIGEKSGTNGCWKADANGEFIAAFIIPANTPIGIREVEMNIPGGPSTKTSFWGAGTVIDRTNLQVETDTIYWKENVSTRRYTTTSSSSSTSSTCLSNCPSRCTARCVTCPLGQTIYINDPDMCTPVISDIPNYSDVQVTSLDLYVRSFNNDTQFFAGFLELSDSGYPKSGLNRWVSEVKVFYGKDLTENGGKFEYGTAKYNVKFSEPIKLKGGKGYTLVVGSPDKDARLWVAKVGESEPSIDNVEGRTIYQTPDRGMLLSSPNSSTWTAYIDEDLKYSIYIKDFFADGTLIDAPAAEAKVSTNITGKYSIVEYDEVNFSIASGGKTSYPNFFKFDVMYADTEDNSGFVKFEYATKRNGVYSDWSEFTPGTNIILNVPAESVKVRAKLYSYNRYSTPSVDAKAGISFSEYVLPSYFVSNTVESGNYNRVNAYIDKFFDETKSVIDLKYSPDSGYTWRDFTIDSLTALTLSDETYSGSPQYQYALKGDLTLKAPEIIDVTPISLSSGESVTTLTVGNTYEVAYCLKDQYDREGPLSEPVEFRAVSGNAYQVNLKFDPNATGFAVYLRDKTNNGSFILWYDSTISSSLKNNLTTSSNTVIVGPEGRLFPTSGIILIGSEYIHYTGRSLNGDGTYSLANAERSYTNMGRTSTAETHSIGSTVYLADHRILGRGSVTNNIADLWGFGNCSIEKDSDTGENYYVFQDLIKDTNLGTTVSDAPLYDESYPASFESNRMTFKIRFSNVDSSSTVGRDDLVPAVGRLIVNTSYEAF